jgi:glucokinase
MNEFPTINQRTTDQTNDDVQTLPLVVGVDLGGTQIRTAILRGPELLSRVSLLTGEDPIPERIIPRIYDAIQQALTEASTTLDHITGIGIGAPGPLDSRTGIIFAPPNLPGWHNVPLRDSFEKHYSSKIPIFVENDANAAGLGEYLFGAGRGSRDMVYLTISTGIGGGVIVDGNIMEGSKGTAGELGHMTIDWHGQRCNCGNIGCLEQLASGIAIARRAKEAIEAGQGAELLEFARALQQHSGPSEQPASELKGIAQDESISHDQSGNNGEHENNFADSSSIHIGAHIVSQAAQAGIPLAHDIITNAAEAIGVGLVNIIHIFNPDVIILGGGLTQMGDILVQPALRIVQERAMTVPRDAVRIVLAELGANTGLIGAGALIYHGMRHR